MPYSRIYLDSNVFIRAFESPREDAAAKQLLAMLTAGTPATPAFTTSQIALAETLVHPMRHADARLRLQYEQLLSVTSSWLQVVPVSRQVLILSAGFRAKTRLKLPDAIHLASAALSRCSHLLSADTDFQPDAAAELGITIVRPDQRELAAILTWLRA